MKYAFLDRDGALIYEPTDDYQVDSLDKLQLLDGVIEGLQWLKEQGYQFVMVTNQNGIGTKAFPYPDFDEPQQVMLQQFKDAGIEFDRVFICPHFPEDDCLCRKPKTGLVDYWLTTVELDRDKSFMYGDRDSDGEFAKSIGIQFVKTETNGVFNLNKIKEII